MCYGEGVYHFRRTRAKNLDFRPRSAFFNKAISDSYTWSIPFRTFHTLFATIFAPSAVG